MAHFMFGAIIGGWTVLIAVVILIGGSDGRH